MAQCTGQWQQLANNKLVLCRRRLWYFFVKFESFHNYLHRLEKKMNKQAAALQKTYNEHRDMVDFGNQILHEIDNTEGQAKSYVTAPAKHEFPLLRWSIPDIPKPMDDWSYLEPGLKTGEGGGLAGELAQIKGLRMGSPAQKRFMENIDEPKEYNESFSQEEGGEVSTPIHKYNPNHGGKGKGRQSNN